MIDFWKSVVGMYRVKVTSASLEMCIGRFSKAGILTYQVRICSELSAEFLIRRTDLQKLEKLCARYGDQIEVCAEVGVYLQFRRMLNRPVILIGIALMIILTLVLPNRILFIRVVGNSKVPTNRILEAAEQCGIVFGTSRESIRSEQVKNGLLSLIPELKWAGLNTRGCVAVLSVRESAEDVDTREDGVASIVALREGVILSCTCTRGNLLCAEGQAVQKGQVLISAYTDCGTVIQATRAEGEIYAQTVRQLSAVKPLDARVKQKEEHRIGGLSLLVGKKRINLWKCSGISGSSCGRMYQEYYLILPGGFRLPLALCVETATAYETQTASISSGDAEKILFDFAKEYLLQDMVAGSVLSSNSKFVHKDGLAVLEGSFLCAEMIGRIQTEQNGEEHGKTN